MLAARLSDWIATVFKIGTLPLAPGTWGSLAAFGMWWVLVDRISSYQFMLLTLVLFIAGVWASGQVEKSTGDHDPTRVVIDEWVGQWIALFLVPRSIGLGLVGFGLFRILDIWKPWPIRSLDRLKGGWAIMADDMAAGLITFVCLMGIKATII